MRNCLVYISGPIAPRANRSVEQHVADALAVYLECVRVGIPAICPHLGAAFPSSHDIDYEHWMALDFAYIDQSDALLMIGDWQHSKGAVRESNYATLKAKPVFYALADVVAWVEKRDAVL